MLFEVGVSKASQNFAEPSLRCLEVEADIIYIIYIKDRLFLVFSPSSTSSLRFNFRFVLNIASCYFCITIDECNCSNVQ